LLLLLKMNPARVAAQRSTVYLRRASPEDAPHIARVFGRAFDEYRRGFGVEPEALAEFWQASLAARVKQTIVAVLADGHLAGFIVTVAPGAKEQFGDRGAFRNRLALMRRTLGWARLWRLPALFIPMGLTYTRRSTRPDEHYVSLVGVDPALQARGIGRALLAAVEAEARRCGAAAVLLHTASTNHRARVAYSRAGYELVSTVRTPWRGPAGIPAYVTLRKPLRPNATPRLEGLSDD
jgi:ribosomal protein S18 acetylase RimI-like enzyme